MLFDFETTITLRRIISIFQKIEKKLPSNPIMYLSYVYGSKEEREKRTLLSMEEIMVRAKANMDLGIKPVKVMDPEHKPFYDQFKIDILSKCVKLEAAE